MRSLTDSKLYRGDIMKTKKILYGGALFVLILIIAGYLLRYINSVQADTGAQGPAACLACHGGSFEKLASQKPAYKASSGEIVNPHQYIPHNEKKPENVPNCTDCHSTHPIPPKEKIDLSKVNVDSCFLSCHHQQNFEPCNNCHKKK